MKCAGCASGEPVGCSHAVYRRPDRQIYFAPSRAVTGRKRRTCVSLRKGVASRCGNTRGYVSYLTRRRACLAGPRRLHPRCSHGHTGGMSHFRTLMRTLIIRLVCDRRTKSGCLGQARPDDGRGVRRDPETGRATHRSGPRAQCRGGYPLERELSRRHKVTENRQHMTPCLWLFEDGTLRCARRRLASAAVPCGRCVCTRLCRACDGAASGFLRARKGSNTPVDSKVSICSERKRRGFSTSPRAARRKEQRNDGNHDPGDTTESGGTHVCTS